MNVLLKSVTIVESGSILNGKTQDILIEKGVISEIGKSITAPKNFKIIDEKGLYISMGWMDMRANFCDPGHEYKEDLHSGLNAAAAGGFTEVLAMPDTTPPTDNKGAIEYIINKTKGNIVNCLAAGCLSHHAEGAEIAEMYDMHTAGAKAFTDNKNGVSSPSLLNRALLYSQSFDGLIMDFPNNKELSAGGQMNEGVVSTQLGLKGIPKLAEELMVNRDVYLAEYCNAKIHLTNISTKQSVKLIKEAKKKGIQVTADVNAHHLYLNEEALLHFDTNAKVMPPLRTKEDIKALISGLKDGTIDAICSDHTPEDIENKQCEFDNATPGMIALQTAFSNALMALENKLELSEIIAKFTANPRKILGLNTQGIELGKRANLTLFKPQEEWTLTANNIVSKVKNTPLLDQKLKGKVVGIINNNQIKIQG